MNSITKEIKQTYEEFKKNDPHSSVCRSLPFSPMWVYYFLFPELLIIYDEWAAKEYKVFNLVACSGEAIIFPCWVLPEEEVLRIMAESGII